MPLDFDTTKKFRDFLISRTLQVPNGPQSFTSQNYRVGSLIDYSNVDPGAVDTNRQNDLSIPKTNNLFKPIEYFVKEQIQTLPRRANLSLYYNGTPYFVQGEYNLVGIMSNNNYDNESELFKFAASYIRDKNQKGPVYSRIEQNLLKSTLGRVRLLDALNGNLATATNIVTGREPLVESNNSITTAKTLSGKAVDFIQTIGGIEFPFTEIPGDYLTNPYRQTERRNVANTEVGRLLQDTSGAILSLLGLQRRPLETRKPSDILIEYTGSGPKQQLFDLLSLSKYAPNYTTTARSQNTSKVFNFVDKLAQGVKNILGVEAPEGVGYIGDDRGNDVKNSMSDLNGNIVRGNHFLSLMFDETQSKLFERQKNTSEGGQVSGKLTWISVNSNNRLGANNAEYDSQGSKLQESLSTNFDFREDSILGQTQLLLDSMPKGGEGRSHIGNVIDQTSRIFKEGEKYLSRGSAIKYVDKFTGSESGIEYCRTWTKDRPYLSYSDTMKKGGNIRKYEGTIVSNPWNLNIGPMSNGNKGFEESTNIFRGGKKDKDGRDFYAKKYMFSIENLAWKTSTRPGFTVLDLPVCERGPNGGRVMWFPPYDLKVTENNSAKWDAQTFLGRPEPIYTYQNTDRSGNVSFKIVVDHPSILNLLTREFFKNYSDEEADNYINAFFAGCEELDFYELIKRYTTLDPTDINYIIQYLNDSKNSKPEVINKYKTVAGPITTVTTPSTEFTTTSQDESKSENFKVILRYDNNEPGPKDSLKSSQKYSSLYTGYVGKKDVYKTQLISDINTLNTSTTIKKTLITLDRKNLFGDDIVADSQKISVQTGLTETYFTDLQSQFTTYETNINKVKGYIASGKTKNLIVSISSATSPIDNTDYNLRLSYRRSYSVLIDILEKITKEGKTPIVPKWDDKPQSGTKEYVYKFKEDLGYDNDGELVFNVTNIGEDEPKCKDKDFKAVFNLNYVAPIAIYCRKSEVNFTYDVTVSKTTPVARPTTITEQRIGPTSIVSDGTTTIPTKVQKPPIDVMKRIIMKTLSECFYFKKLEESSPLVFNSLREKLRYFHPAFHSTTPEGLNSRLTFLHQCIRPGDTIPIKGLSDVTDINARNTTFGPPPICVLRIGDFYHSKVVIRDVNITYDDSPWDMNPEGIGYQPMIANVQLSISFIGGQGLERPVERLQNALSSNFYANTEIYDERSEITNTKIAGQDSEEFTKEFLEDLQKRDSRTSKPQNENQGNNLRNGKYIGELSGEKLSYSKLIVDIHTKTKNYFDIYDKSYNIIVPKYGPKISNLILSQTYRVIKTYDVWTPSDSVPSPSESFDLVGLYTKGRDLFIYTQIAKSQFLNELSLQNLSLIFGFDKFMDSNLMSKTNQEYLDSYIKNEVNNFFNDLSSDKVIKEIEDSRNALIQSFDKINFVVKHGKDFKIDSDSNTNTKKGSEVELSGFTKNLLYDEYEYSVDYIKENSSSFYSDLDTSINFSNPIFTSTDIEDILKYIIKNKTTDIISLFTNDATYTDKILVNMAKSLGKYTIDLYTGKKFKFKKYKAISENTNLIFDISTINNNISETDAIFVDGIKLNQPIVEVSDKLNYYKITLQ